MGFMTWELFRCGDNKGPNDNCTDPLTTYCISDALIRGQAQAMVSRGFVAAGYTYASLDDCWMSGRDAATHELIADPSAFPGGTLERTAAAIHALGMKLGTYTAESPSTCCGHVGSANYEQVDAANFAKWGVDYLKVDGCNDDYDYYATGYPLMGQSLEGSGRPIAYSCSWPDYWMDHVHGATSYGRRRTHMRAHWLKRGQFVRQAHIRPPNVCPLYHLFVVYNATFSAGNITSVNWTQVIGAGCNQYRVSYDIDCNEASLFKIIDFFGDNGRDMAPHHGPGHWMDADQLIIGNGCISPAEERTQMAIWCVMAQPLFASTDFRNITADSATVLLNAAAIAIDQDALGVMGLRLEPTNAAPQQRWAKPLSDGGVAVALTNRHGGAAPCSPTDWTITYNGYNETCGGCRGFNGLTLGEAEAACCADDECAGFSFSNRTGGPGQGCYKADHNCGFVNSTQYIGVFKRDFPPPVPPPADIMINFADVNLTGHVAVYDVWLQQSLGVFVNSFTAKAVAYHDTAFLKFLRVAE